MTPEGSADLFRIHYQNAEILTHVVHRQLDPNCDLGQGLGDTWGRERREWGGAWTGRKRMTWTGNTSQGKD